MRQTRDKFLTEAMGECWHQLDYDRNAECTKCGKLVAFPDDVKPHNNFSTWEGFGKLWDWATQQEWWDFEFSREYLVEEEEPDWGEGVYSVPQALINPDRFADTLYYFLKGQSHETRTA